jgi:hypothetical protein
LLGFQSSFMRDFIKDPEDFLLRFSVDQAFRGNCE